MVITLNVANESNEDFSFHGEDSYFLSVGETLESCRNSFMEYLKQRWYYYEFEDNEVGDVLDVLKKCLDKRPDFDWAEAFEGFESTVLSHEMDHLDGILHMDIADEVLIMTTEERKEFRKTHEYNIISKKGNFEELLKGTKIKGFIKKSFYLNNHS